MEGTVELNLIDTPKSLTVLETCVAYVGTNRNGQKEVFIPAERDVIFFDNICGGSISYSGDKQWVLDTYKDIRKLLPNETVKFNGDA